MLPTNDTDSTYVGIMKNYNIPEGKVKEKAHIFDSKEAQYVEKKTTGSVNSAAAAAVDLDKSYNLYDSKVKEKANLIEKRKVFMKIPSFVMPSSRQPRGSVVVKPKAIIASDDEGDNYEACSSREVVMNGEISSLQPSMISKRDVSPLSSSIASAVPSVDEDTHRRGVSIPSDSKATSSAVLNDQPSRFYLQALSERRKLFHVGMKVLHCADILESMLI